MGNIQAHFEKQCARTVHQIVDAGGIGNKKAPEGAFLTGFLAEQNGLSRQLAQVRRHRVLVGMGIRTQGEKGYGKTLW